MERWTVFKSYYKDDNNEPLLDTWCILYGTQKEAEEAMAWMLTGRDKSWFDPAGNDYAGYDATLYVDRVWL
jgi:hypothetical protein